MTVRRWILLTLALLVSLSGGGALAFGPFVRAKAQDRADRYGITLQIDSTRPALFGVRLKNVRLNIPEIPALSLQFDDVFIDGTEVSIQGGGSHHPR